MEKGNPTREKVVQTYSDNSIEVAGLLTLSGGFLDVFTYLGPNHIFANSMTGNIVFFGIYTANGSWQEAAMRVPSIVVFLLGVLIAYRMRVPRVLTYLPKPALTCLGLEIIVLFGGAIFSSGFPDLLLVLSITLVAAMQNSSFTKLEQWTYNSVMTTGNLRRFAEALFRGLMPVTNREALREAKIFGTVCICFFAGAIIASLTTVQLKSYALLIPAGMLSIAFIICWRRENAHIVRFKFKKNRQGVIGQDEF